MLFSKDSRILIGFALQNLEDIAKAYYKHQEYNLALDTYLDLIKKFPRRDDLYVSVANCQDAIGDKKAALQYYLKALKINPNSLATLTNLATAYYEAGELKSAEKFCWEALKRDAENTTTFINLGNIFYRQNKYEQALVYYQKAATLKPDYYIVEINLANTFFDLKNYQQAFVHAKKSVEQESQSQTAYTLLGNSALELEDFDVAIDSFLQALKIDSRDAWTYNSLSQAYQKKSLWQEALAAGWNAIEKSNGEEAHHINFGYMFYEAALEKQESLAEKYVDSWLEKYGENPIVSHMGNAFKNNGNVKVANQKYVQDIFDVFAPDFETVLSGLEYQAPRLISGFVQEIYEKDFSSKLRILDAGCGTGLCGKFLKKYAGWRGLDGVDLSPKMLEAAATKKLYNHLIQAELVGFLKSLKNQYHLIVSADVFTYIGDLENLFLGLHQALKKEGRVIFSVSENSINQQDWFLHISGRFLHRQNYIENILQKTGFELEKMTYEKLRNEGEQAVMGFIVSAKKIND